MDYRPALGVTRSVVAVVLSLIGAWASLTLVMTELTALKDPGIALACDVNPLIGCSNSLLEPVAHLAFGVPNSVLGVGLFGALTAIFALGAFRVAFPKVVWWGLLAGTAAGTAMVVFFLTYSIIVYRILCPYCMVVWASVLALAVLVWTAAIDEGVIGGREPGERRTSRYAWLMVLALYLVIVLVIVVALSDKIAQVL